MAVTINARGTSSKSFKIGKKGTTIYQGSTDPAQTETVTDGDIWFNTASASIKVRNSGSWNNPVLDNISISGSTISSSGTIDVSTGGTLTVNGSPVLTSATYNTDVVSEGTSNLYFTDARARSAVSVGSSTGLGSLSYNSTTGEFTYTGPPTITLGTDTTGDYVESITSSDGITVTGGTGAGSTPSISVDNTVLRTTGNQSVTGTKTFSDLRVTADPTQALQVASKQYVDNIASGLDSKQSVRAATTANITLSGEQTVDGVALVSGDRVLVKNQSTASANGIYDVDSGAWTRSDDADGSPAHEVSSGMYTFVEEGTTQANTGWVLATADPISLGTTALSFTQFSRSDDVVAGEGLTRTGNTIDVNVGDGIHIVGDSLAVTADVLRDSDITTTALDRTSGKLTKVGDFGLGFTTVDVPNGDVNMIPASTGFYALGEGQTITDGPTAAGNYQVMHMSRSIPQDGEIAYSALFAIDRDNLNTYVGSYNDARNPKLIWEELFHSGNSVNPLDHGIGITMGQATNTNIATSFDAATTSGIYFVNGNTADGPNDIASERGTMLTMSESSASLQEFGSQLFLERYRNAMWYRKNDADTWSEWNRVWDNDYQGSDYFLIQSKKLGTINLAEDITPYSLYLGTIGEGRHTFTFVNRGNSGYNSCVYEIDLVFGNSGTDEVDKHPGVRVMSRSAGAGAYEFGFINSIKLGASKAALYLEYKAAESVSLPATQSVVYVCQSVSPVSSSRLDPNENETWTALTTADLATLTYSHPALVNQSQHIGRYDINHGTIRLAGVTTANNDFIVNGVSTLNGALTAQATSTLNGLVDINNQVTINHNTTIGATSSGFNNGWLRIGNDVLGWSMDDNEIWNSGEGIIGSFSGKLRIRAPNDDIVIDHGAGNAVYINSDQTPTLIIRDTGSSGTGARSQILFRDSTATNQAEIGIQDGSGNLSLVSNSGSVALLEGSTAKLLTTSTGTATIGIHTAASLYASDNIRHTGYNTTGEAGFIISSDTLNGGSFRFTPQSNTGGSLETTEEFGWSHNNGWFFESALTLGANTRVGGTSNIGSTTWANGWFKVSNNGTTGWSMDGDEIYNSSSGTIGTLSGNLLLNPAGSVIVSDSHDLVFENGRIFLENDNTDALVFRAVNAGQGIGMMFRDEANINKWTIFKSGNTNGDLEIGSHNDTGSFTGSYMIFRRGDAVTERISAYRPIESTDHIQTDDYLQAGPTTGGAVALTVNDGYGDANVTFNHRSGTPGQIGNAGRIVVNVDDTSNPAMIFQTGSVANTSAQALPAKFQINANGTITYGSHTADSININGTATVEALRVESDTPTIVIKDTNSLGNAAQGWLQFEDSTGNERGRIGNLESTDSNVYIRSQVGSVRLQHGGANNKLITQNDGILVFGNVVTTGILRGTELTVSNTSPTITLNDTDATTTVQQQGRIFFQRSGVSSAVIGFQSSTNSDLSFKNIDGSVLIDSTDQTVIKYNGVDKLTVHDSFIIASVTNYVINHNPQIRLRDSSAANATEQVGQIIFEQSDFSPNADIGYYSGSNSIFRVRNMGGQVDIDGNDIRLLDNGVQTARFRDTFIDINSPINMNLNGITNIGNQIIINGVSPSVRFNETGVVGGSGEWVAIVDNNAFSIRYPSTSASPYPLRITGNSTTTTGISFYNNCFVQTNGIMNAPTFVSTNTNTSGIGADILRWSGGQIRRHSTQGATMYGNDSWQLFHSGDNAVNLVTELGLADNLTETTHITSDGAINIRSNRQTSFAASHNWAFATNGNLTCPGVVNATSDARLKNDLGLYTDYQAGSIQAHSFTWRDREEHTPIVGYIAQEVQETMPDAVAEDDEGILSVNYDMVHTAKIAQLENTVSKQAAEIENLKAQMAQIIKALGK